MVKTWSTRGMSSNLNLGVCFVWHVKYIRNIKTCEKKNYKRDIRQVFVELL